MEAVNIVKNSREGLESDLLRNVNGFDNYDFLGGQGQIYCQVFRKYLIILLSEGSIELVNER